MNGSFKEMLEARFASGAHLCVGLDPKPSDVGKLHKHDPQAIKEWLMDVVDATAPNAATFKPNLQFYLRWGWEGIKLLEELNKWMLSRHKDIPRILDAKWGDIGDTNLGDVAFAQKLGVQAVTIHNYMGVEAMTPLLGEFFCFVLCKTSNPGSGEFQDLPLELHSTTASEATHLYGGVARHVKRSWGSYGPGAGLVVGATHPGQLAAIDADVEDLVFLIPGVGKQGGTVQDVMASVHNNTPLINVSSGVTSAEDPAVAAMQYNNQIKEALAS
jgi:orotidine 5'-phosphate decarboxylase subfamily 2